MDKEECVDLYDVIEERIKNCDTSKLLSGEELYEAALKILDKES